MTNTQAVQFEELRSLGFASISGSYAAVGTPFEHPVRLICITNNTDGEMLFSTDASTDMLFIAAGSFKLFDLNTNRLHIDQYFALAAGTQFYVKQNTAPTEGDVYIEVLYG